MRERGLELSEETAITHIDKGFDFLGQNVSANGKMLIVRRRKKT
ncbi:hypothetical protein [Escherichia coli]